MRLPYVQLLYALTNSLQPIPYKEQKRLGARSKSES